MSLVGRRHSGRVMFLLFVVASTLHLTSCTPYFVPDSDALAISVQEDAGLAEVLLDFNASSTDSSTLSFLMYPGGDNVTPDGRISLHPLTGILSVAKRLDREDVGAYDFQIMVTDGVGPSRRDLMTITISVIDVNDNAPMFDPKVFTVSLDESTPATKRPSFESLLPLEAGARWSPTMPTGRFTRQVILSDPLQGSGTVMLCDLLTVSGHEVMLKEEVIMQMSPNMSCFSSDRTILFEQTTDMTRQSNAGFADPVLAKLTISDSKQAVDWLGLYDNPETASRKPYQELYTFFRNESFHVRARVARATSAYANALDGTQFGGAFKCPLRNGDWSSGRVVSVPDDIASCSPKFTTGNLGNTWNSQGLAAYSGNNDECVYLHGLTDQLDAPLSARVDASTVGLKVFVRHTCRSGISPTDLARETRLGGKCKSEVLLLVPVHERNKMSRFPFGEESKTTDKFYFHAVVHDIVLLLRSFVAHRRDIPRGFGAVMLIWGEDPSQETAVFLEGGRDEDVPDFTRSGCEGEEGGLAEKVQVLETNFEVPSSRSLSRLLKDT